MPEEQYYANEAMLKNPVDSKTDSLNIELNRMGEQIDVLRSRLSPVLKPVQEKEAGIGIGLVGGSVTSEAQSMFSLKLQDLSNQANAINRNVAQILRELDF